MEREDRQVVNDILRRAGMDPVSVENGDTRPGTPDINFREGWIEMKRLDAWPKREDTAVRLPLFTQQQKVWLLRRWSCGGSAWLLLHVAETHEWLLFDGETAGMLVGTLTRGRMLDCCAHRWSSVGDMKKELPKCLSRLAN